MNQKYIFPKNKVHFMKLVSFARKIIEICNKCKANPTIYGSFVHFYHTKDQKLRVNDIDLLVQPKYLSKIAEQLEKNKIKFKFYPYGIIVKRGKLKVEIDRMEKEYEKNSHPFFKKLEKIDFYGLKVRIIALKQLEEIYKTVIFKTKEDKIKMGGKIKHLENFLGRKLK
jgi:hypothetical protein